MTDDFPKKIVIPKEGRYILTGQFFYKGIRINGKPVEVKPDGKYVLDLNKDDLIERIK